MAHAMKNLKKQPSGHNMPTSQKYINQDQDIQPPRNLDGEVELIDLEVFMARAWGKVAMDFINAGNIGAAAFAARSAARYVYIILGDF